MALGNHVYLCTPVDPTAGKKPFVAKVLATPYPADLREELSQLGLAPALTAPVQKAAGGVFVVRMAYLDPAEGWVPLRRYQGDWEALEELAESALDSLHTCLNSAAVHGNVSADNVFVR